MFSDVRRLSIFRELRKEHAGLLTPLIKDFSCQAGTLIFQQGSAAILFYVITRGRVEISYKPYDGNKITVTHVETGGLFGWSAVVGSRHYTSSATAIDAVDSIRVKGIELRAMCSEHPDAGKEILNCLANAAGSRWKDAHEQVKSILEHGFKK